jgi:hypothetical protein
MNIRGKKTATPSSQPALDLLAFAFMPPELARANLRCLLIENPNYFGSLSDDSFKTVLHIEQDTTYECLSGVDFNPRLECIGATIQIRQPKGYSSGKRPSKSQEFVRFYLSVDNGENWLDQGVCTLNVSDKAERTCTEHQVGLGLDPGDELLYFEGLPRLRAILSWNQIPPPDVPDWLPVWGNVLELNTETEGTRLIPDLAVPADTVAEREAAGRVAVPAVGTSNREIRDAFEHSRNFATVISAVDAFSFGLLSPRWPQLAIGEGRNLLPNAEGRCGAGSASAAILSQTVMWGSADGRSSHTTSGPYMRAEN